jgi:RimJ/RimL family protein N-acetyltransferase
VYGEGDNTAHGENGKMKLREMTTEDMEYMKDNSVSRGILKHQPECLEFCYSLEHEGNLLCIGGIRLINTCTAWCWLDLSHHAGKEMRTVYRIIKEWILEIVKEKGIKRLQAYVELDFPEAIRMVQHLGFEKEGILKDFLPSGDASMYVRIF